MCSTLAHRPELEQRAGAGCGGGSQGRGLSQGPGALLLKAKVQVSRTATPCSGQGSGRRQAEGSLGRAPGETGGWSQPAPAEGGGGPEHRGHGLCRQRPHGQPPLLGKGSR